MQYYIVAGTVIFPAAATVQDVPGHGEMKDTGMWSLCN